MARLYISFIFWLVALLDALSAGVFGQATYSDSSSNVQTAVTTATNGSATDLHLHVSGKSDNGWIAVGIGSGMVGALMFIIYPNSAKNGVTVSVRSASGHVMPSPLTGINYSVNSSSISGDDMSADFVCYGCTTWPSGKLDVTSTDASWIYAIGPGSEVASDDVDATIRQHSRMGTFRLDMTAAAQSNGSGGASTTPGTSSSSSGSSGGNDGDEDDDSDNTDMLVLAHAGILIATMVGIFPLGAIFLRLPWGLGFISHLVFQLLGTLAGLAGMGIAIAMSIKKGAPFNTFRYAHQIVGLVVLSLLVFQAAGGFVHHSGFKKTGRRSAVSWIHMGLGRIIIIGGMVNAILGFRLDDNKITGQIAVGVVSLVVLIVMEAVTAWARSRATRSHGPGAFANQKHNQSPPRLDNRTRY